MQAIERRIKDWFVKIRTRQILLPRFQRFEAWGQKEIGDLLTSVLQDLPVGSTLILAVGDNPPFISRPVMTGPEEGDRINELLLDGQQRLTALWRSMKDNYLDKSYFVSLSDTGGEKKPVVLHQSRWEKNGKRYPLWVDNPNECWRRKSFPVRLLDPDINENEYQEWASQAADQEPVEILKIERLISPLRAQVANFNIPLLWLPVTTPPDVAIEVFIKLNTNVVPLSAYDIVVAQTEAQTGESLHELASSLVHHAPEIRRYADEGLFVLGVASLLQDKPPNQTGFLSLDFGKMVADKDKIFAGTKLLTEFLEEEGALDEKRTPTESILTPLAALWTEAPVTSDEAGNARILFRKYLWRAFVTERYDRAVPTAVLQDYRALRKVIRGAGTDSEVPIFDKVRYPYPNKEIIRQARWPKYRDRLARAILLLTIRGSAEDIADGTRVNPKNVGQREYHHVYPAGWLRQNGLSEEDAYRALNCILITWKTNRIISAKEPVLYLRERSDASSLGEAEVSRRLSTHFVDFDLLSAGSYSDFLEERAGQCENAIRDLCDGLSWKP